MAHPAADIASAQPCRPSSILSGFSALPVELKLVVLSYLGPQTSLYVPYATNFSDAPELRLICASLLAPTWSQRSGIVCGGSLKPSYHCTIGI
jgi:hypothetical protein